MEALTTSDTAEPTRRAVSSKSTNTTAQLARIVEALRRGPQTTDTLRALGIYQVSARIFGLRAQGFEIHTALFSAEAADSYMHNRMARYTLMSEPKKEGV